MPEDDNSQNSNVIEVLTEDDCWHNSIPDVEQFTKNIVNAVLEEFEPPFGALDILLCNDARIHELNQQWRGQDKPTNVLSFEAIDDNVLGNIAIAHDYCLREAQAQHKAFKDHITHMIVHGVLHLVGYDHIDDDEAAEMEALEVEILGKLGINNPYEYDGDLNRDLTGANNAKF